MRVNEQSKEVSVISHTDEIDLFDLVDDVKDNWGWLLGAGLVCTLLALLYAVLSAPTYQTEILYKPVTNADLLPLNQPRLHDALGLKSAVNLNEAQGVEVEKAYISAEQAFASVRTRALSGSTQGEFYQHLLDQNDSKLISLIHNPELTYEQNFLRFAQRFSVIDPSAKEQEVFVRLKFELSDAQLAAQVLNDYSQFLLQEQAAVVQENVTLRIDAQLDLWRMQAEELRTAYYAQKQQRLLELQEAAAVAASIQQQRPLYDGQSVVVGSTPPLFMLGEKALRAQITLLQQRQNEDAYINGLPELLGKINVIENAEIAWNKIKYIQIDQAATVPLSPIKPKKLLILVMGMLIGGMLGLMLAIVRAAWLRRVERKQAEKLAAANS